MDTEEKKALRKEVEDVLKILSGKSKDDFEDIVFWAKVELYYKDWCILLEEQFKKEFLEASKEFDPSVIEAIKTQKEKWIKAALVLIMEGKQLMFWPFQINRKGEVSILINAPSS